jgi:phage protein D
MSDPSPYAQPRAAWRVTLDGADLTATLSPRLISLRLTEKSGEEADALEIVVQDTDAQFLPPRQGATLSLALGWSRGTGVPLGLVNKGTFTVDELTWSGPPDRVTITAHSANFKGSFRTRKTRSWHATTLGQIVAQIAADNALTPACHPDLAAQSVPSAEQHNKSDMQFIRDLGRQFDALATVKAGTLLFAPRGATTSNSNRPLPTRTITRQQCSTASWRRAAREKAHDGAQAQWHDQQAGRRKPSRPAAPTPPPQARLPQRTRRPRRRPGRNHPPRPRLGHDGNHPPLWRPGSHPRHPHNPVRLPPPHRQGRLESNRLHPRPRPQRPDHPPLAGDCWLKDCAKGEVKGQSEGHVTNCYGRKATAPAPKRRGRAAT